MTRIFLCRCSEPPIWISATGTPETFAQPPAAFNVLTTLLGGNIDDVAPKIALYRKARPDAGLDPTRRWR